MQTTLSLFKKSCFFFLLLAGLSLVGCGQSNTTEEESGEFTTTTSAETETSTSNTGNESPIGSRQAYVPPKATQNPLTLGVSNQRVKSGSPVCLDVQVADFDQLLSMQYSVKWDPAMLQFKNIQNFQLAGLGPEDFGAHRATEGILTSVWIDESLQGKTIADGATIYQICFQVVGSAGQSTEVNFSDGPTPFEVVNLKEEVVDIKGVAGRVTIN